MHPRRPNAGSRPEPRPERREGVSADPERVMRTCPICGAELAERKCKLVCPDPVCGYFLSCADYY